METVTNIRTVLSFGDEEKIMGSYLTLIVELYGKLLEEPLKNSKKKGIIAGISFGNLMI